MKNRAEELELEIKSHTEKNDEERTEPKEKTYEIFLLMSQRLT